MEPSSVEESVIEVLKYIDDDTTNKVVHELVPIFHDVDIIDLSSLLIFFYMQINSKTLLISNPFQKLSFERCVLRVLVSLKLKIWSWFSILNQFKFQGRIFSKSDAKQANYEDSSFYILQHRFNIYYVLLFNSQEKQYLVRIQQYIWFTVLLVFYSILASYSKEGLFPYK